MNKNREKGHRLEREVMHLFQELGYTCATSRNESRTEDAKCIDLCGTDPFAIQCKHTDTINIHTELSKMDAGARYRLLFHKRTRKGTVVAMPVEDFKEILQMLISSGAINPK